MCAAINLQFNMNHYHHCVAVGITHNAIIIDHY